MRVRDGRAEAKARSGFKRPLSVRFAEDRPPLLLSSASATSSPRAMSQRRKALEFLAPPDAPREGGAVRPTSRAEMTKLGWESYRRSD